MATRKLSITVDTGILDALHRQEGEDLNFSAIVNDALSARIKRHNLIALLDEMDREAPITSEGLAAGEALWQRTVSSLTPGR